MDSFIDTFRLFSLGPTGWGDELLRGAFLTLQLAVFSLAIGMAFGVLLAWAKLASSALFRWPAIAYTLFIRGVPEFLVLLLVFFGSEQIINGMLSFLGLPATFALPRFAAAVAGLSFIYAAYSCEVFKGAFLSVPSGQMEAAAAIGMSPVQAFFEIRLPQLWRFAVPGLGNLWLVMLKDTSLAAVLAVNELLRVANLAAEATRNPLLFLSVAGFMYLAITALSDLIRARIEARSRLGLQEG